MKIQIEEGIFESYGPNQSDHAGRKCDYIDLGGKRLPAVNWDVSIAYAVENSLGKHVRFSFVKDNWGLRVAAIQVDGRITKSTLALPSNYIPATIFAIFFGFFGILFSWGVLENTKGGSIAFIFPFLISLLPSFFTVRGAAKEKRVFDAATNALG
jgi:hypothetical protein